MNGRLKDSRARILRALKCRDYPNCTAYIIWHYLTKGDADAARRELHRDGDKLTGIGLRHLCEEAVRLHEECSQ